MSSKFEEVYSQIIGENYEKVYEVDEAMMGDLWKGDKDDLKLFGLILQEILNKEGIDVEVKTVTDSYNGAENRTDEDLVPEVLWNKALNELEEEVPGVFG